MNHLKQLKIISLYCIATFSASSQPVEIRSHTFEAPVVSINAHIYQIANACENGDVNFWTSNFTQDGYRPRVAFSPTGSFIALGNDMGKIELWDDGNLIKTLEKHEKKITSLDFNDDGRLIVSGSKDKTVKIWGVTGICFHTLSEHSMKVNCVAFGPGNRYIASGSDDATVKIWDAETGVLIHSLNDSPTTINSVCFSTDGQYLAAGNTGGDILIWNVEDKKLYKTYTEHKGSVSSVVFHPNSMYLASGGTSNVIKIWNIKKDQSMHTIQAHDDKINTLDIIRDNAKNKTYLLSGSSDKKIKIWDINTLAPRYDFLVKQYANEKIQQWQKKKSGETAEEYKQRVTATNRKAKYKEYMQEAINKYALEKYTMKFDSLDHYDRENETFRLYHNAFDPVIVQVPKQEAASYKSNFSSLIYSEPRFALTDQNDFVLNHLKMKNPDNNKHYVFNADDKISFSPGDLSLDAAPIEVTTEVAEKEEVLKEKLEKFTKKQHREKKITKNVETSVNAKAVVEENEKGEEEINFHIEYKYKVIKAAVENRTDDFPPGEYRFSASNAARITLQVLQESLENELAQYLQNEKRVTVKITGTTDAMPISGTIPYNGEYGNFNYEPYYLNSNLESITITKKTGINSNEQLAFLRTHGVRDFMEKYITILNNNQVNYQHFAELSKEKGGEYRRIAVEVIIHNAFDSEEPPATLIANKFKSDVDKDIPENNIEKPHTYALVIGNEDYSSYQTGLEKEANVEFAVHDAEIFSQYLEKTCGIPAKQIKIIKNGTTGQIRQGLAWISNLAKIENGKANIIFYYSGHGLPHEVTKEPYIIPVDVSGNNIEYAIKLQNVYDKLTKFPAKKVSFFIDACFSGGGKGGMLVKRKGIKISPKENLLKGNSFVLTSSTGNQSSGIYEDKYHGYFTYFLLKKIKETKGDVSYKELTDYVITRVEKETALAGKIQKPSLQTSEQISDKWGNWQFK